VAATQAEGVAALYSIATGDAPVFEFVQRDAFAGHRATHERAGADDLEIAVEIANAGFLAAGAFETVHHDMAPGFMTMSSPQIAARSSLQQCGVPLLGGKPLLWERYGHLSTRPTASVEAVRPVMDSLAI
jgi:hypothetical protein